VPERRLVRRERNPLAKSLRRRVPLAFIEGRRAAHLVRHRALDQRIELEHQRIGRADLTGASRLKMRFRFLDVAHPPVRHRQRIVNHRRRWI
jgi:hypothetical protein